jgi:hypothetical protein
MSNLNFENIVGFKAVDKDGNEQNVTVDEMVDMVSTRMVMALSETSTFAAAAATGNDVYENELPTVTDAANVRVLQSSGDAAKMTMQSLASKLRELIGINDSWFKDLGLFKGDLGTIKKSGICRIQEGSTNTPIDNGSWGILVTFYTNLGGGQDSSIQIMYYSNGSYYIRNMWYGNWSSWARIATTAV